MRRTRVLAIIWLLFGVAGKALGAQDTVRVRADNPPQWGANVQLTQEFVIGQLDGPPEYAFGDLHAAVGAPDGSFFVFDANDRQIRRYDKQGKFLNAIGKQGGGPGEYKYVAGMDVTREGLLVIKDPENSRVTYFHADGRVQRDFPVARFGFYGQNIVTDTSGLVYMIASTAGRDFMEGGRQQYLRLTREGAVRDSILLPARLPAERRPFWLSTSDGMRWNFTPRQLYSFYHPGGYLAADARQYRITVIQPGRRPLVIERGYQPVPLADAERAEWVKYAEYFRTSPRGPGRAYEIPQVKPAIRDLRSDHQGRIWVEVFVAAEKRNEPPRPAGDVRPVLTWKERTTYDLFSPKGDYLTRVTLPAQTILLAIRDDRLITRTKGPDGEDRIAVLRMQNPQSSP